MRVDQALGEVWIAKRRPETMKVDEIASTLRICEKSICVRTKRPTYAKEKEVTPANSRT
ncbi:hypothetical protein MUP07_09820 [Candidatus Bathyarchaeota archaeon]|nr:hypothetical protein [Candidatus Bathyarchaeota archaeon]